MYRDARVRGKITRRNQRSRRSSRDIAILVARRRQRLGTKEGSWRAERNLGEQAHPRVAWSPYYILSLPLPLCIDIGFPLFPSFSCPLARLLPDSGSRSGVTVTSRDTRAWYKALCQGSCRCDWHQRAWLGRRSKETERVLLQESR